MALEVIKPPLQPASQDAVGGYGNAPLSAQMGSMFSAENCNPNMNKESGTPVRPKKTPVKSKTVNNSENGHDVGKPPARRRLDCETPETLGKSPAKVALLKESGASPNKHFCRSPRCAANNPDYAVPAPRQYLKSRRHLLAGWQPPQNSKLKASVRGEDTSHGCNSHNHTDGEVRHESCAESDVCGIAGESSREAAASEESQHLDSQDAPETQLRNPVDDQHGTARCEEVVTDVKDRTELPTPEPFLDLNAAGDCSLENSDEVVLTASTSTSVGEEVPLSTTNPDVWMHRADPVRTSVKTDSDFSMRSIGEEGNDSRRETVSSTRPPRRRYHKRGGRRLSSGTASNQSVALNRQEGLKRKQADEWMWDTAIKEAVQQLAPQIPVAGSVNVIVKAFESVKLTEEEIQRAKYKNDRLVLDCLSFQGGCGAFDPHVLQVETMASINKVQAWDESMALADLNVDMNADKATRENGLSTPKSSQGRIPQYSSKSEPPKAASSRWATVSDESMNGTKDDGCSERGASSISGKSRTTAWTCGSKSQAGHTRKPNLKRSTSLHPFRLRTQERGAVKEYLFSKRLQQMWEQEERLRIPLAQGLPWTTEEPTIPPKPLVKEQTKPEGFKLFTDVRAIERAEFDGYIAERNSQMELQKQEEERQRQIAEGEEVRRLRREMVPRAQLMPFFDRPFMPRRSSKKLTVPKEPKFHLKQNKRPRCMAACNSIAA